MKKILDKAIVPISLLLANIANFIIQIIIPRNLSPVEYSQFTLAWSAGLFISALFFEWVRVFLIRYGQDSNKEFTVAHKYTIVSLYKIISIFLSISIVIVWIFFYNYSLVWISSALFFAVFKGIFDGIQASDRANFRNKSYAQRWLLSSSLGLIICLLVSYFTGIGYLSIMALSLSFPIAIAILNLNYLKQILLKNNVDKQITKSIYKYGLFLSISTLIMSLFPFLLRLVLVTKLGENSAAGLLLALEIGSKTVLSCGMFINILLLQYVIKKVDSDRDRAGTFMSHQVMGVAALIIPLSMIFLELLKYFSIFIAPLNYLNGYLEYLDVALIFSLLITLKLYAIDPLFAISGKTPYALIGSLVMVISIILTYFTSSILFFNHIYIIIIFPILIGLIFSIFSASLITPIKWDYKNILSILIGSIVMFYSLNNFFAKNDILSLFVSIMCSSILYLSVFLIFNMSVISKIKFTWK